MGLDQYAFARKGDEEQEIAYWRKHPNLQGWMEELYQAKGGTEVFNCVDLELNLDDLEALEHTLDTVSLPPTGGFFFGENADDFYAEQDREFILAARNNIKNGYKIIYTSWW